MSEENDLKCQQLARQDQVDNQCHILLENLAGRKVEWDMEYISAIREAAQEIIVDKLHLMTEMEFYPYIEEEEQMGYMVAREKLVEHLNAWKPDGEIAEVMSKCLQALNDCLYIGLE